MRRLVAFFLVLTLALASMPVAAAAPAVSGAALPNHQARLRSLDTNVVVATTTTDGDGAYAFDAVAPGTYVVEALEGTAVVGTSDIVSLPAGGSLSGVLVRRAAQSATQPAHQLEGLRAFLGSPVGVSVVVAALTLTTVAVVATRGEASPSR